LSARQNDPEPDYPWRDRENPLFTPLALAQFCEEQLSSKLFPTQQRDLEAFLGTDPKTLFESDRAIPYTQAFLLWGKGCLGENEQLTDYLTGQTKTVKEWAAIAQPLLIKSWDGEKIIKTWASPVYMKGEAELFRITLSDGRSFVATGKHRCLSQEGWLQVDNFEAGQTQLLSIPHDSNAQTTDLQRCSSATMEGKSQRDGEDWGTRRSRRSPQSPSQESSNTVLSFSQSFDDFYFQKETLSSSPSFCTVIEVKSVGDGLYYDLTVPATHCYFDAQNVLHHNSGKDYVCSLVQAWVAHLLLCLKNPQQYLEQAPGEPLDIVIVAYNQSQSRSVFFYKFKQRIKKWTWLQQVIDELHPEIGSDRWLRESGGYLGADSIILPQGIRCWAVPATPDSFEGKNLIFWVADEMAAFASPTKQPTAKRIHDTLVSSARTRFGNRWRGFAISFPRHRDDYMCRVRSQVELGILNEVLVTTRATWEVNPNRTRADFDEDYRKDPEGSAMRYECIPPAAVDAYFRSPALLYLHATGCAIEQLRPHLPPDIDEQQLEAIASQGRNPIIDTDLSGDPVLDHRGFPKLASWFWGQKDLRGDRYEYFIHLDPGKTGDAFGFVMGHIHEDANGKIPVLDLAFRWTGRMFRDFGEVHRHPWYSDTLEQKEMLMAAEVDFRTVREFVFYLAIARRFNIAQVSIDRWNSAEGIQALRQRGFNVVERLVCKEDYDEFKSLVYNRQLRYYGWPILLAEAEKLQLLHGTKVDAPRSSEGEDGEKDSHKDVTDGAAAVCRYLTLLKDETVDFYRFEPPQDMWEKAAVEDREVTVEQRAEEWNATQQEILKSFFEE
jgi:hypothetical protein